LQTVYRDRKQPLNVRVRCAIEALNHKYGKVSARPDTSMSGQQSFAERLERAIMRSQQPVPLLNGPVEPLPATVASKPFPRPYRRFI
jgi:hypothetical protein